MLCWVLPKWMGDLEWMGDLDFLFQYWRVGYLLFVGTSGLLSSVSEVSFSGDMLILFDVFLSNLLNSFQQKFLIFGFLGMHYFVHDRPLILFFLILIHLFEGFFSLNSSVLITLSLFFIRFPNIRIWFPNIRIWFPEGETFLMKPRLWVILILWLRPSSWPFKVVSHSHFVVGSLYLPFILYK